MILIIIIINLLCFIQLANKKRHRTRHSDSTTRVTKILRHSLPSPTNLKKNVLIQPVTNCLSTVLVVKKSEQRSVGEIHAMNVAPFKPISKTNSNNFVSDMKRALFTLLRKKIYFFHQLFEIIFIGVIEG